ncbi:MAG TPA: DUF1559 domain-containing protein [Gemmataceae bacterium]|nr:DUF1559 domain-containing protein [Gemmataceae bacterium]
MPFINGPITAPPDYLPPPEFNKTPATCTHGNTPSSPHSGLIMVALADGSVRTVNASITGVTWAYAMSPVDRQPLGPDW